MNANILLYFRPLKNKIKLRYIKDSVLPSEGTQRTFFGRNNQ